MAWSIPVLSTGNLGVVLFIDEAKVRLGKSESDILATLIRLFSDPEKPDGDAIMQGMKREFPRDDGGYDFDALCAKIASTPLA